MTLVVGLVHGGRIYMGADSAEADLYTLSVRHDSQVFCRTPFLFGVPGTLRLADLLCHTLELADVEPGPDLHTFVMERVADQVRQWVRTELVPRRAKTRYRGQSNALLRERENLLLVGCRGYLFTIGPDYQVAEPAHGYDAIGTGEDVALGALYATRGEDPVGRVTKALQAAERLTGVARPPFHVCCLEADGECGGCQATRPQLRAV